MTNPLQPLDPQGAPDPVTPADSPSSPLFDEVTPHGRGPAPYDIQAPLENLSAMAASAEALTRPGGPRAGEAEVLLNSAQGFGAHDITTGWSGGGGDNGWPGAVDPGM